jgi:hypothetical protein
MSITTSPELTAAAERPTWRTRALGVLAATAATLVVWVIADPLAGVDLAARTAASSESVPVGPVAVVVSTLLAGLAGWGLLAVLERFTSKPARAWTVIALAVLLLSLIGPFGSGVGTTSKLVLASMHLVAGAVLIPVLARSAGTRR